MKFCYSCGNRLEDDANFCTACGKPQNVAPQEAAAAADEVTEAPTVDTSPATNNAPSTETEAPAEASADTETKVPAEASADTETAAPDAPSSTIEAAIQSAAPEEAKKSFLSYDDEPAAFILGLVATCLGGLSIILAWIIALFGYLFGGAALTCAIISYKRRSEGNTLAKIGLGLSIGALSCALINSIIGCFMMLSYLV